MKLKRLGTTALTIVLVLGSGAANIAYAVETRDKILTVVNYRVITPFWVSISSISPKISADGSTLYPEVYVKAKSSSGSISGTMYLEKYVSGNWTNITSWSLKGTGNVSVSKSYQGSSGTKYRVRVVITVDGEKAEAASGSCQI